MQDITELIESYDTYADKMGIKNSIVQLFSDNIENTVNLKTLKSNAFLSSKYHQKTFIDILEYFALPTFFLFIIFNEQNISIKIKLLSIILLILNISFIIDKYRKNY